MGDVTVTGVDRLERLGRDLKALGDKGLRRELFAGIQRATKPLKADVRRSALDNLPASGGLNQVIAAGRISTRTSSTGRNVGVRIAAKRGRGANRGRLRHPVYGNRKRWVNQQISPGWFSNPLRHGAGAVRAELGKVFDDVARRIGA